MADILQNVNPKLIIFFILRVDRELKGKHPREAELCKGTSSFVVVCYLVL